MKAIDRRLKKLENSFAPPVNEAEARMAALILESRRVSIAENRVGSALLERFRV
jgi:hypothetical protein